MSSPSLKVSGRLYQNVLVVLGAGMLALSSLPVALAQASESASASAEASSATPSAGPEVPKKENCTIDEKSGKEICGLESKPGTLPGSAKAAIVIVVLTVVFLLLATIFYIRRSRRAAAEADKEVAVEESQMTGPAHVLNATYTPETGHSRVYSIGPDSGALSASVPVPLTPAVPPPQMVERNQPQTPAPVNGTPAFPSPSVTRPSLFSRWGSTANSGDASATTQPQTAPANKATFATFDPNTYPFSGFGNSNGSSSATPPKSAHPPVQPRSAFVSSGGFPRPLLAGRLKDRIRERPPSVSSLTVESPNK